MNKVIIFVLVLMAGNAFSQVDCPAKCAPECCTLDPNSSAGTPPYTYEWTDASTAPTLEACTTGTYSVTTTDACMVTAIETFNVTINEPNPLTCRHRFLDPTEPFVTGCVDIEFCPNDTRRLQVDAEPAADDNNCTVTDPNGVVYTASAAGVITLQADELLSGTWTYNCIDANGCDASLEFTMVESADCSCDLVPICAATDAPCNGGDGEIVVTENGVAPYTYIWSNGATANPLIAGAGTYTVTVTDDDGCTGTCEATILEPTLLTAACAATDATCNGATDGTATVVGFGGTSGYTYLWSDGQTTATATGLGAGTYTATVTDPNGCTATCTSTVSEPTPTPLTSSGSCS